MPDRTVLLTTHSPVAAERPPCPSWCVEHFDLAEAGESFRHHFSAEHAVPNVHPQGAQYGAQDVVARLERFDVDDQAGPGDGRARRTKARQPRRTGR